MGTRPAGAGRDDFASEEAASSSLSLSLRLTTLRLEVSGLGPAGAGPDDVASDVAASAEVFGTGSAGADPGEGPPNFLGAMFDMNLNCSLSLTDFEPKHTNEN